MTETNKVQEFCDSCGEFVEIEAQLETPQLCPKCESYVLACSLCESGICKKCKLEKQRNKMNSNL